MPYLFIYIFIFITCCSVEKPERDLTAKNVAEDNIGSSTVSITTGADNSIDNNDHDSETESNNKTEISDEELILAENENLKGEKPEGLFETDTINGDPLIWSGITHYKSTMSLVEGSEVSAEAPELSKSTVLIQVGGYNCTGTLIGPRTVITAAHCLAENSSVRFTPTNTRVGFGSKKASLTYVNATHMSLYPDYDYSGSYIPVDNDGNCTDYGFLTLEKDAPLLQCPYLSSLMMLLWMAV